MSRACLLLLLAFSFPAWSLERVALQLKWKHQFQFAGYYAALEKGYYRDAGFDVELREALPETDVLREVLEGRAEFGVGTSELVLARAGGEPVVALAVVMQHSPLAIAAREDRARLVQDLAGRRVMLEAGAAELFAYLGREGLGEGRYQRLQHDFTTDDLIAGRVDAMSVYASDEPYLLRQARLPYALFSPRAGGIDFYGDNLFTSDRLAAARPDRVAAFRDASLRGWRYAMRHPEEIADLILARYSQRHSRDHLLFEAAEMAHLMQMELVEIGHMHTGRWRHIADTYVGLGMLAPQASIDGLMFDSEPRELPPWVLPAFAAGSLAFMLVAAFAWRYAQFNRALNSEICAREMAERSVRDSNARLRRQLDEIAGLQAALREQATRDGLTGCFNRRYLDETLEREIARARRDGQPLSVVMLDLDHFKQLNDTCGHQVGDAALREVAEILRRDVRTEDVPCRYGGEEFLILMPQMPLAVAAERAEAWRQAVETMRIPGSEARITLSVGIAAFPEHGANSDQLTGSADQALYRAKRSGRNRVAVFDPTSESVA